MIDGMDVTEDAYVDDALSILSLSLNVLLHASTSVRLILQK